MAETHPLRVRHVQTNKQIEKMKYTEAQAYYLLDYIKWNRIVEDYELKRADISLEQETALGKILFEFIAKNK